ncbi:hypothetical protein [Sphingomonas sp. TF3]|uniref:hypothetical protein n=1 Tax=Sphingomonas sp. TF3 TaxID=2495580 RepID=UPI00163B6933|nr:hypothetical protein [Sphingomonas sp. TF3]
MELNTLGPADSLTRFLEAQFVINAAHLDSIYDAIGRTTTAQVRRNFEAIYAAGVDEYYPGVTGDLVRSALAGARIVMRRNRLAQVIC